MWNSKTSPEMSKPLFIQNLFIDMFLKDYLGFWFFYYISHKDNLICSHDTSRIRWKYSIQNQKNLHKITWKSDLALTVRCIFEVLRINWSINTRDVQIEFLGWIRPLEYPLHYSGWKIILDLIKSYKFRILSEKNTILSGLN